MSSVSGIKEPIVEADVSDHGWRGLGSWRDLGATTGLVVRYVRETLGEAGTRELLELAGSHRSADELSETTTWSSLDEWLGLLDAAERLTGDRDVGIPIGAQLLAQYSGTEVAALLRSLGSPGEVLRNVAITAAKYTTISVMEALEVEETRALICARNTNGQRRTRQSCNVTVGVLTQAPPLFGMAPARVEQLECEAEGDDQCLYRVTWDPTTATSDAALRVEHLERELAALTSRFETLQSTAAELVSAEDVETVLAGITRRAGLAVRAPRYLLAVRVTPNAELRVHHSGLADDEVRRLVAALEDGTLADEEGARLIAAVESSRRHYGQLVAFYPRAGEFFTQERKLLDAYARHAAAALDTAAALADARQRDRTARTLLGLAGSLAEVATPDDVARRVVEAVPSVVDCNGATVLLWDAVGEQLSVGATTDPRFAARGDASPLLVSARGRDALRGLIANPVPVFVDNTPEEHPLWSLVGHDALGSMAMVPIVARGEFLGLVTTAVASDARLSADDDLLERLTGLADQAAVALQNAHLLERVQQQALHDALTDLANQRLLETRVDVALANARRTGSGVALLFVDLDGFKQINDQYGHDAGDAVLRAVARRLRSVVRGEDTVARFGGDEFVVVLTNVRDRLDIERTIERIRDVERAPITISDQTVTVDASIGTACFPADADNYTSLLRQADADMYRAKTRHRDTTITP